MAGSSCFSQLRTVFFMDAEQACDLFHRIIPMNLNQAGIGVTTAH